MKQEATVSLNPRFEEYNGKIFGVGWAKTGTTTLGQCLQILGYKHQTQRLDLVPDLDKGEYSRIFEVARNRDSFEDWPWLLLFEDFDKAFPGSRFILTVRDPSKWIKSYSNMLSNLREAPEEMNQIRTALYGLPFPNVTEEQLLDRYNRHNREVLEYFKGRPSDLLILDWGAGDDWEKLCLFLGKEIPSLPFPSANKGNYSLFSRTKRVLRGVFR